jgi:hypothetical protein
MRLASVRKGDTIEAKVRGYRFPARVLLLNSPEIPGKPVRVEPLVPNVTFYHLSAHQIDRVIERAQPQGALL